MTKDNRGFTTKEFVMVIAVITLLCVLAIPPFFAMQNSRRRTEMETTLRVLQTQLQNYKRSSEPMPATLDSNPIQSPCLDCFKNLGNNSLNNPLWYKFSETTYLYSSNGNHTVVTDYQEPGDYKIEYDSSNGELKIEEIKESQ